MAQISADDRYDRFKGIWGDFGTIEVDAAGTGSGRLSPRLKVTVPSWIDAKQIPLNFEGIDVVVETDHSDVLSSHSGPRFSPKETILMDEPINIFGRDQVPKASSSINDILKEDEFNRIASLYPKLGPQANLKAIQMACIDTIIANLISFVAAGGNYDSYKSALDTRLRRYEK
jgi:hypothetical protein